MMCPLAAITTTQPPGNFCTAYFLIILALRWPVADLLQHGLPRKLLPPKVPIRKNPAAIDQRLIEYVLALTDGVTGGIIDLLRRAAVDALGHKSKSVGIDQLLMAGAHLPAIINQRTEFPI
jgi:hypothetical protein